MTGDKLSIAHSTPTTAATYLPSSPEMQQKPKILRAQSDPSRATSELESRVSSSEDTTASTTISTPGISRNLHRGGSTDGVEKSTTPILPSPSSSRLPLEKMPELEKRRSTSKMLDKGKLRSHDRKLISHVVETEQPKIEILGEAVGRVRSRDREKRAPSKGKEKEKEHHHMTDSVNEDRKVGRRVMDFFLFYLLFNYFLIVN